MKADLANSLEKKLQSALQSIRETPPRQILVQPQINPQVGASQPPNTQTLRPVSPTAPDHIQNYPQYVQVHQFPHQMNQYHPHT